MEQQNSDVLLGKETFEKTGFEHLSNEELFHRCSEIAEKYGAWGRGWFGLNRKSEIHDLLKEGKPQFITKLVQGQRVIDLGCGHHVNLSYGLIHMGARAYIGVDLDPPFVEDWGVEWISKQDKRKGFIAQDALLYLDQQPANSAIIMVNKLFDEPLSPAKGEPDLNFRLKTEYAQRLLNHMYRVTPDVCFGYHIYFEMQDLAKRAGFQLHLYDKQYGKNTKKETFRLSETDKETTVDINVEGENFFILHKQLKDIDPHIGRQIIFVESK